MLNPVTDDANNETKSPKPRINSLTSIANAGKLITVDAMLAGKDAVNIVSGIAIKKRIIEIRMAILSFLSMV